jgi:hypothetical protein
MSDPIERLDTALEGRYSTSRNAVWHRSHPTTVAESGLPVSLSILPEGPTLGLAPKLP